MKFAIAALVVMLGVVIWLAAALVETENERYALSLGMCVRPDLTVADYGCLRRTQTRTSWIWHVYYPLRRVATGSPF